MTVPRFIRTPWSAVAFLVTLYPVHAQLAPAAPTPAPEKRQNTPVDASPSAPSDRTIRLTPFEVLADADSSYGALNSNAITKFETELQKLPISADIFTEAFMKDTGSTSVEEMIQTYSAGAGYTATDSSATADNTPGDRNSGAFTQLRGLSAPVIQRDGFMPLITGTGVGYTNNFDLERVEIVNGPQALLYGAGGPGGVINLVSKQARLGKRASGSIKFQLNQYGGKVGQFDYGFGTERVALRLAIIEQNLLDRRDDIGGPLSGLYGQLALKIASTTVARLSLSHTDFDRVRNQTPGFSAAGDARNGQILRYLLATDQLAASSGGRPSGAGVIANGHLNWNNVDSLLGWRAQEPSKTATQTLNVDTQWNRWLTTQISVGHTTYDSVNVNSSHTLFAPNHTNNPLKVWAIGSPSTNRGDEVSSSSEQKAGRFSAMATNAFLGGRVTSQSILGADTVRIRTRGNGYKHFLADATGEIIVNPNVATDLGRTIIPALYWSIQDGIQSRPLWKPGSERIVIDGRTYVRAHRNPNNPALVAPNNPLGVVFGGGPNSRDKIVNSGIFGANFSQWMQGRLTTLAGFRYQDVYFSRMLPPAIGSNGVGGVSIAEARVFSFNVGVNYRLTNWLSPYVAVSDSFNSPAVRQNDPYGEPPDISKARGQEAGFKISNERGTISGSLAFFQVKSANEQHATSATLLNAINPVGLNGRLGTPNSFISVDRESKGLQVTLIAAPKTNWRIRFSGSMTDGKIGTTTGFDQVYNDQFYANAQGQVTFANGTVVYVPPTFNANMLTVPAGTPGAIPLTIAMMSTSGNPYYANPVPTSGAINAGSNAARVLGVVDPVHGSILTGRTGLPISQLQINPGFTPIGHVVTSRAGESSVGFPRYAANMTQIYTFNSWWLKDVSIGGTVSAAWDLSRYYFYPNGVTPTAQRQIFKFPASNRFDLIVGYRKKIKRFGFSTQVNVSNLFNRYEVIILPNALNGYAGPNNATFSQEPRKYLWTNTITF